VNDLSTLGLVIVVITAGLMVAFTILGRKRLARQLRDIPAYAQLRRAIGLAVEEGTRLHVSLGKASIFSDRNTSSLIGLSVLERIAQMTLISDRPPLSTSGDPTLSILSQDVLSSNYRIANNIEAYNPSRGRITGLTPFSYAAGVIPAINEEQISTNILIGNFGNEIAILTDAIEQKSSSLIAASDHIPAQAILYASTQEPLIGEELYGAGAYLHAKPMHVASLQTEDALRWLCILIIIGGAIYNLLV